ncbi:MAG: hypothetical protein RIT26_2420, partial [Pseudomonadota bacterium]
GEDTTHVHVRERQVGFVFQHYALFRHMSVFDNVAFGLRVRPRALRPSEDQIKAKVHELLNLVRLDWLADRYPSQLSGGQRQRIALARALAVEPKVLLLDEPFGALDAKVRKELRRWLRMLHQDLDVTSIFVTHDQEEALEVSDRVVLMNQGQIEQIGTPQQVWDQPASPFVYGFLGDVNLFRGEARDGRVRLGDERLDVGLAAPDPALPGGQSAWAYVRPHDVEVRPYRAGEQGLVARLNRAIVIGPLARLELEPQVSCGLAGETVIEAQLSADRFASLGLKEGELYQVVPRQAKVFMAPVGR